MFYINGNLSVAKDLLKGASLDKAALDNENRTLNDKISTIAADTVILLP